VYRREVVAHLAGDITEGFGAARSNSAPRSEPKTLECRIVEHHTGMCGTRSNRTHAAPRAKRERGETITKLPWLVTEIL
jgi:hypothetical protein